MGLSRLEGRNRPTNGFSMPDVIWSDIVMASMRNSNHTVAFRNPKSFMAIKKSIMYIGIHISLSLAVYMILSRTALWCPFIASNRLLSRELNVSHIRVTIHFCFCTDAKIYGYSV